LDIHQFDSWIGRQLQQRDILTLPLVQRLAAALDCDPAQFSQGDALPKGWHAVLFSPLAKTSDLDADGHPRRGDFLPPIPLPRRLFAGRRLQFKQPLRIDSGVIRAAEVTKIRQVEGKTGLLVFVTARYTLSGLDGVPSVIEEQDVAYRGEIIMASSQVRAPHAECEWGVSLSFDAPRLFRFSAAVFNAHRIHYDADYTRDVEGYDGLIVNASLLTLHLLGLTERHWGLPIDTIDVRNRRLVFVGTPVDVQGCVIDGKNIVQASQNGKLCVEMRVNIDEGG
jgi:3-methylfumaryl-CoA hydratase